MIRKCKLLKSSFFEGAAHKLLQRKLRSHYFCYFFFQRFRTTVFAPTISEKWTFLAIWRMFQICWILDCANKLVFGQLLSRTETLIFDFTSQTRIFNNKLCFVNSINRLNGGLDRDQHELRFMNKHPSEISFKISNKFHFHSCFIKKKKYILTCVGCGLAIYHIWIKINWQMVNCLLLLFIYIEIQRMNREREK